jgi:hypothetical protein
VTKPPAAPGPKHGDGAGADPGLDARITEELATIARAPAPARAAELIATLEPTLTEWSFNSGDDPRGALRFGAWTGDHGRVAAVLRAHGQERACQVRARLPLGDMEGLGLAWSPRRPATFRWWLLAPGDGAELYGAALRACPEIADAARALAGPCSPSRCTAVGLELGLGDGALLRSTVYFALYDPRTAIAVLEMIGCPPSLPANAFFRGLCGLDPHRPRPWPKVWVGRSAGAGAGWKVYYFARGDMPRPADEALLELTSAAAGVQSGAACVRAAAGVDTAVQLLGLTFRDDAPEPVWTTYLARR